MGDKLRSFCSLGSGPGQLYSPHDVAVDDDGYTLMVENGNKHIRSLHQIESMWQKWTKVVLISDSLFGIKLHSVSNRVVAADYSKMIEHNLIYLTK